MESSITAEAVTRLLGAAGVRFVRLEFSDLHGIARSKILPLGQFPKVLHEGTPFYGGMLHSDARADDLPPDAYPGDPPLLREFLMTPDLSTLAVLEHAPGTARVVCDLRTADGEFSPLAPRNVARRLIAAFAAVGYLPRLGFEYEFYLTDGGRRPVFADRQLAATLRNQFDPAFVAALFDALPPLGIKPTVYFVENAPGQIEVTFEAGDGLVAPDQAFAFRTTVKELAVRHGYLASFMTKPIVDEAASGGHVHQSLISPETGANAFAGVKSDAGDTPLSDLACHYLAGQLLHAPALAALLSPTVNCYKRYRPHIFAPTNVSWGYENRQAAIRVPHAAGQATRVENRIGGAAADPYVAAAGLLAAGLDGLRRRLTPPPPSTGDITEDPRLTPLPRSLDDALDALEADAPLCALLGEEFVTLFLQVKRYEAAKCRTTIPDYGRPGFNQRIDPWEVAEYGELI